MCLTHAGEDLGHVALISAHCFAPKGDEEAEACLASLRAFLPQQRVALFEEELPLTQALQVCVRESPWGHLVR